MAIDSRFLADSGREVFTGNELLVKGALETEGGVHLLTGYPGSPVAGFFDILGDLKDLLKTKGVRAYQANNEALAAAALNGSQMIGARGLIAFKSVGTHVASDALALGNMAGAHADGGAVVISGEDPWCESTQVPADSRFLFEHLRMPVVEPGTPQEVKDWINLSFKLSQVAGLFIGYIATVAHADGGGTVDCWPNQFPLINTNDKIALDTTKVDFDKVLLPPRTWQHELKIPERFAATIRAARELGINRIIPATNNQQPVSDDSRPPIGFIVTGMGGPYLEHVLADLGLTGVFPILKMGMSYPVDTQLVAEFARHCKQMVVIEERRSFLEKGIRDSVFQDLPHEVASDIASRLFGKRFPKSNARSTGFQPVAHGQDGRATEQTIDGIPDSRGLNVSVLAQKLIPLIKACQELPEHLRNGKLSSEWDRMKKASKPRLDVVSGIVPRTPTFCPGCPHRDSSAALLELRQNLADERYMRKYHRRGPIQLVSHGDTGCYTMLMFAPTQDLMHNYSGMGLGAGTGTGIDPFITNKQLVFMGDGTFFHSGQVAISNAIKASQDICFIILENGTTAMTGHQEHAGTDEDILGNRHYIQDIESIVRGMAGKAPIKIVKLRPDNREKYKKTLEKTILADGVKIIIADKECGITHHRSVQKEERKIVKKHGYLPRKTHMNVTPEVCEGCLECTKQTACPGLVRVETDYGAKIDTDLTWCVNDGACERVRVSNDYGESVKPCPSFEQVTVVRQKRRRYLLPHMALDKLPEPTRVHDMTEAGRAWRVHMAGVGGMGIGVVGAILVRAGHKEGYRVLFQDKKGLAIRNGGVFSQITFVSEGEGQERRSDEATERRREDAGVPTSVGTSYPTTGNIPYGKADLLLGIDILEGARAVDPREQFRIGSKEHTAAVLNLHKQPTVYHLLGKQDFDPEQLRGEILEHCNESLSYSKNLSELCEQRLGSKQFANIMMLGVAYQLGLIPVSAHAIAWAIKDTIRREQRKNIKAFNIGRKLALEPRALPNKPQAETWEQLVTNKGRILRKTRLRGRTWAERYEQLVHWAMKQMRELPEDAKYDLALRIYDCLQYEDHRFARKYIERVRDVYRNDNPAHGYQATVAVIWNLAKVMLIKDEPYVSYLLTRYEKRQRDIAKYGADVANGDRLVYKHHTNPEFVIAGRRFRFKVTTRDWQLKLVSKMKWWRHLPGWHKRELAFRDWYVGLLDRVSLVEDYGQALRAFTCPDQVSGYREIRYPKMDSVKVEVEQLLSRPKPAPVESVPTTQQPQQPATV